MASFDPKRLKMDEDRGGSCSTTTNDTPIRSEPYFTFTSSKFKDIVKMKAFVDKTKMIETIFKDSEIVLITAPRRFGKSTILDMVKTYVELQTDPDGTPIERENESSNYNIFCENNLLIYQNTEFFNRHFATYPVIHVSFKSVGVDCSSHDEVLLGFKSVVHEAFKQHSYLLNSDKLTSLEKKQCHMYFEDFEKLSTVQTQGGLEALSEYLYKHFNKKVFVLIDEYDAPINNALFNEMIDANKVNNSLSAIFSPLLKGNEYVERALLTGISFFASYQLCTVNNIEKYMFLRDHPFVEYYGLTEAETDKLLSDFKIEEEMKKEVKSYYNGYHSEKGKKIFSTWSVLHYLKYKQLKPYWQESGLAVDLNEALHIPVIRHKIETLFQNVPIGIDFLNIIELRRVNKLKDVILKTTTENMEFIDANLYVNLLLQQGYLAYTEDAATGSFRRVVIPNTEILWEFTKKLKNYYSACPNEIMEKCAVVVDKISANAKEEIYNELIETFEQVISDATEQLRNKNERAFYSLLFNILCKTKFKFGDEKRLGRRLDLMITCDDINIAIVFEIKYNLDAKKALQQIIDKNYDRVFNDNKFKNVKDKIYIGLNVDANGKVTLAVLINSLKIEDAKLFPM